MRLAGLVLAGGAGSRMGGGLPKPLIAIAGKSLAGYAIERLLPHCEPVLISANDPDAFARLGHRILPDLRPGLLGPLAGLEAAAAHLAEACPAATHLACLPGDTPFLPSEAVPMLAHGGGTTVRVAACDGRLHPTVALWPLAALAHLRPQLDRPDGARSLRAILERVGFEVVDFPADPATPGGDPFFNVNTPDDLVKARRHLESR